MLTNATLSYLKKELLLITLDFLSYSLMLTTKYVKPNFIITIHLSMCPFVKEVSANRSISSLRVYEAALQVLFVSDEEVKLTFTVLCRAVVTVAERYDQHVAVHVV